MTKRRKKFSKKEGFLSNLGLTQAIDLSSWQSLFDDLKAQDFHVIVESVGNGDMDFTIGPISKVTKRKIHMINYDPTGKLDKNQQKLALRTSGLLNLEIDIQQFLENI